MSDPISEASETPSLQTIPVWLLELFRGDPELKDSIAAVLDATVERYKASVDADPDIDWVEGEQIIATMTVDVYTTHDEGVGEVEVSRRTSDPMPEPARNGDES